MFYVITFPGTNKTVLSFVALKLYSELVALVEISLIYTNTHDYGRQLYTTFLSSLTTYSH